MRMCLDDICASFAYGRHRLFMQITELHKAWFDVEAGVNDFAVNQLVPAISG